MSKNDPTFIKMRNRTAEKEQSKIDTEIHINNKEIAEFLKLVQESTLDAISMQGFNKKFATMNDKIDFLCKILQNKVD